MFVNELTNVINVKLLSTTNNISVCGGSDDFHKCFSKRVAKRIRNLQAKFINT